MKYVSYRHPMATWKVGSGSDPLFSSPLPNRSFTRVITRHKSHLTEANQRLARRFSDEKIARLWENSSAAREEFPDETPHVRRAIAMGRLLIDPLAVLASLFGTKKEILSLRLTELQDKVKHGCGASLASILYF